MKDTEMLQISNSPAISLIKATIADLQFIKDLSFDEMNPIVSIAWKGGFRWKSWFKDIERAINDGSQLVYVVQQAENNIGYLWMNIESSSLWITAIVLTKGWQRKQIGSMIVKRLVDECKNSGMESIELGVQQNNTSALDFYIKLGFEKFDQIGYASTNLMRLDLTKFEETN
jgi:ribosomal protein S18 acetylase RimI-like enzyme